MQAAPRSSTSCLQAWPRANTPCASPSRAPVVRCRSTSPSASRDERTRGTRPTGPAVDTNHHEPPVSSKHAGCELCHNDRHAAGCACNFPAGDDASMNPIEVLRLALVALTVVFTGGWAMTVVAARRARGTAAPAANPATDAKFPSPLQIGVGAATNFFDTLGIGSFATTTALFRVLQ